MTKITARKRRMVDLNSPGNDVSYVVAREVCEAINTPTSLAVSLLIKYEEWDQLATKSVNPSDYLDAYTFADDAQAVALLRKADHLPTSFNKEEVACRNFFDVEKRVGETNRKIIRARWFPNGNLPLSTLISNVRVICHQILGDQPDLAKLGRLMGFGKGASSSCKRSNGHAYGKVQSKLDSTPALHSSAHLIVNHEPLWPSAFLNADGPASVLPSAITAVRGAKVQFVPKDAKTHRVIAVEPHVNVVLQKGIGELLTRIIRRWGIRLDDQGFNQKLARLGYKSGYSTIDLSNASDMVSTELVREVLPPAWFSLLDIARSNTVSVKGSWMRLEKFSTAGCGFTFPLESLIFFAICKAASGRYPKAVYGDDIIVEDEHFSSTICALEELGFVPNRQKSFSSDSPFRESCGEDFFQGIGVRPFFIRGKVVRLSQRMSLHNQIIRYALRRANGFGMDDRFSSVLLRLRGGSRLLVPYDLGDIGFAASYNDAVKSGAASKAAKSNGIGGSTWIEGYMVRGLIQRPYRKVMRRLYAALYQSFTATLRPFSDPTLGLVNSGTGTEWSIGLIPVMRWSATDTFEIHWLSDLS